MNTYRESKETTIIQEQLRLIRSPGIVIVNLANDPGAPFLICR